MAFIIQLFSFIAGIIIGFNCVRLIMLGIERQIDREMKEK